MSDPDNRTGGSTPVRSTARDPGESDERRPDAGSVVVGSLVALAGALFFLQPFVSTLAVGPVRAPPVALSAVALTAGFCLGGVVFLRQGRRLLGIGHAGMGGGWALVLVATGAGSSAALVLGAAVVAGTAFFLVARSRDRRWGR